MIKKRFLNPKMVAVSCAIVTLVGCQAMVENPIFSSAAIAIGAIATCKLADGSDAKCAAAGIAAGGISYAYLKHQLKKMQEIENVQAQPCVATNSGKEAYCVTMNGNAIRFASGSDQISAESMNTLKQVANVVASSADTLVYIEGHTDSDGSASYNQGLSEKRALSVRHSFISQGVGADRIQALGYGESKLIQEDAGSLSNKKLNRRVELRIEGGNG